MDIITAGEVDRDQDRVVQVSTMDLHLHPHTPKTRQTPRLQGPVQVLVCGLVSLLGDSQAG